MDHKLNFFVLAPSTNDCKHSDGILVGTHGPVNQAIFE